MKDGIYFVKFKSSIQDFGEGAVVVNKGIINGADFGFTYKGRTSNNKAIIEIFQHDLEVESVFGDIKSFQIELVISDVSGGYLLKGGIKDTPNIEIIVEAKYVGDLLA